MPIPDELLETLLADGFAANHTRVTAASSVPDEDFVTPLASLGVVRVSGADAAQVMQGQFTNDINDVDASHAQLSGICNPKGRLIATFQVLRQGADYLLLLDAALAATAARRLGMFVLRADAAVVDASAEHVAFGIQGAAEAVAAATGLPAPTQAQLQHSDGNTTLIRLTGEQPGFLLVTAASAASQHWQRLKAAFTATAEPVWERARIDAGMPWITAAASETLVPQMINYQAVGGVSFSKGCYTGQEIVARMQYLGTLKKRLYRVVIDSAGTVTTGDSLYAADAKQAAGVIVNAAPAEGGGYVALAVIRIDSTESATLHLGDANGPIVALATLPYAVELAEAES